MANNLAVLGMVSIFSNCLCFLPVRRFPSNHSSGSIFADTNDQVRYWATRFTSPDAIFDLSPGDSEAIWYAQHYWLSTGVAATALLILMTFTGWWYQQRMRLRFRSLVERIDAVNKDDARENGLHSP